MAAMFSLAAPGAVKESATVAARALARIAMRSMDGAERDAFLASLRVM